jgi:hypothetical protein
MTDLKDSPAKCPTCLSFSKSLRYCSIRHPNGMHVDHDENCDSCSDPWHDAAALPESREMPGQPDHEVIEANLADYAQRFYRLFDMYMNAWLREMGGVIVPKHHTIDGFVLRMRGIYEKAQLVDRIKQIMVSELKKDSKAEQMFDAVFEMLAKDGYDKVPTS